MVTPQPGKQGPSAPVSPKSIYDFLSDFQQGKIRLVATGSSEPIDMEPNEGPHVLTAPSGETRRSSVFDPTGSSSSTSSVLPLPRLPCEFDQYDDCEETFDLNNVEDWVHHIDSVHLGGILPMNCICWFCDDGDFRAVNGTMHERQRNYTARMRHIADHYHQATTRDIRPDFDFLDHLHNNGLISEREFDIARNFHEAPQPRDGINTVKPAPSVSQRVAVESCLSKRRGHRLLLCRVCNIGCRLEPVLWRCGADGTIAADREIFVMMVVRSTYQS
ncbi:hypothetical protein ACHAQJ_004914 [Trichoderma viride]